VIAARAGANRKPPVIGKTVQYSGVSVRQHHTPGNDERC
jgi:hypothetical protein